MGRTGTKKLLIKKEGFELQLEQQGGDIQGAMLEGGHEDLLRQEHALRRAALALHQSEIPGGMGAHMAPPQASQTDKKTEVPGEYVVSPMVGTFYTSPSPDEPPFIKVGDKIEKNTVVCIIEAMKVMNEIKAGVSGTVAEVLVETAHPVEFGTKMFRLV